MKNDKGDGILCCYCGEEYKEDFTYYSLDFSRVNFIANVPTKSDDVILSCDLCERCMELFKQRIIQVADKIPQSIGRCDVTGEQNLDASNKSYYVCKVDKIVVQLSNKPYKCIKCDKDRSIQEGPCDCGSVQFYKDADQDVDESHLDLNFSSDIFTEFRRHIEYIRNIGDEEWTN